jgi:hypothetical protein
MPDIEYQQIHLFGKGLSGRAVRYVTLNDEQVEHIELEAAREIGKEGTNLDMWARVQRMGMELMVKQVSDPCSREDLPKASWKAVTPAVLHGSWRTLFTNKDTKILKRAYDEEHEVTRSDLDAIMAGKVQVLGD